MEVNMKKFMFALVMLALSGVTIFAGGSQSGSGAAAVDPSARVTIRWAYWGSAERIEKTQQAINLYESRNPGVRINPEPYSGNSTELETVRTQIAGGYGPDIIQMGGNWPDLASQAEPLEAYAGKQLETDKIDQAALAAVTAKDGHLYGISTGNVYTVLVYNKTLLERSGAPLPPKVNMTWDEFRAYLVSIKEKLPAGVYPIMDIGYTSQGETPFGHWQRTKGIVSYDAGTGATQLTPAYFKEWLDLWADYRANGLIPPADVASQYAESNADTSALVAGKVAITYIASSMFGGYQAAVTDELELIALPGANAQNKAHWAGLSQVMMVNKDSKNKEETVKFINWITISPEAAQILAFNRGVSASGTYRAAVELSDIDKKITTLGEAMDPFSSAETDHTPNDAELVSQQFLIYQRVQFGQINTTVGAQQLYDERIRLINKK
jgi:multiple sugar transport system substrate-binding protein